MPAVSVIIPTYNRAHILGKAIDSVCAQTLGDWQLIVVDDGSTDDTKARVERYGDKRIRYHYQENKGVSAARNVGMSLASADWIAYLDSDNTLLPNYLGRMAVHLAGSKETVFAFPKGHRYLELYVDGKMVERKDSSAEFLDTVTPQDIVHRTLHTDTNGLMHRRRVFDDGVRFDEEISGMEDWDFLLMLAERYPGGFLYIPELLYSYSQRFGGDGLVSNTGYRRWAEIFEYIYQKHKNDPLMQGQKWYPDRVNKWNDLADKFERGEIPPYHLWYFPDHWPSTYVRL